MTYGINFSYYIRNVDSKFKDVNIYKSFIYLYIFFIYVYLFIFNNLLFSLSISRT